MKTGTANLPLHGGKAPRWLFERMTLLAREFCVIFVEEHGTAEFLRRLSDPFWFQALGCVLGFDWHSSGVTTTVCGALKEGLKDAGKDLGFFVAGGKGGASRKTPQEIEAVGMVTGLPAEPLVYASRMAAKVDSAAVQDGYQLYHHAFFFDGSGRWAVVQQGMNDATGYARRYHWLSESVHDFVDEPHAAVCCDARADASALNFVAAESLKARETATELSHQKPQKTVEMLSEIAARSPPLLTLDLPARHPILRADIHPQRLKTTFVTTYERQPEDFEQLLGLPGVGPATLRALAAFPQ